MSLYKNLLKPVFFSFDPERIHRFVVSFLKIAIRIPGFRQIFRRLFCFEDKKLIHEVFGLHFPNPIGLAAGFDKDAELIDELSCLGFGFIEVGTVTPLPQPGNEKPRMFRLPADEALINRMGFNNGGVEAMVERLKHRPPNVIVGGNIGKNKNTANENAGDDYEICFRALFNYVDYFVVNVSSPNTPNLRALQDKQPLKAILLRLQKINSELSISSERPSQRKPLLLKIAPDLADEQLDEIVEVVQETGLDGVIATNTTIERTGLKTCSEVVEKMGAGGLSGKPLTRRATDVIRYLSRRSNGSFVIIGVGGIHSPEDALEKMKAGASLVQLYTGFIYEGPALIKRINRFLAGGHR